MLPVWGTALSHNQIFTGTGVVDSSSPHQMSANADVSKRLIRRTLDRCCLGLPGRARKGSLMRTYKRNRPALGLLMAFALLTPACGSDDDDSGADAPVGEQTDDSTAANEELTVAVSQEPPNWDYTKSGATAIKTPLLYNVVETLVEKQSDGSVAPMVAESWEVSGDGTVYTFTIREAKFHDGSDLDSTDVVESLEFNRAGDGDIATPFDAVNSIEATDDRTVVVTLAQPSQAFLNGMATISSAIVAQGTTDQVAQGPVGTGPFTFEEWKPDVSVEMNRFSNYWGDAPYFSNVTWRFITDETASLNALLAGDIDVVAAILGEGIDRVSEINAEDGLEIVTIGGFEISYLSLNAQAPIFQDPLVVQAVNHAIDRQPIVDAAFAGLGELTCTFVNPPNEPWSSDYCPYDYDPAKSQALLKEAGVPDLVLPFKYLTIAEFPPIQEVVTAQLTEAGFNVELEGRELTTYLDEVLGESADYTFTSLSGPSTIDAWKCPGFFTLYCDPEFDQLLIDAATDSAVTTEKRLQAVEMHADAGFLIPIVTKVQVAATRSDLKGIKLFTAGSEFDLGYLRLGS